MNRIARLLARPIISFLLKPTVRYYYLPRLREVISYDRKETMLHTCLEYVNLADVKGDYVEFGIWRGRSLIAAYHISKRLTKLSEMRFYGFDSFQGIPVLTANRSEAQGFPPGIFRAELEEVQCNLTNAKVDMSRITLIPGWYADTLNEETKTRLPLKAAAVVNVDCDVFESTVPVLDFIEPYLVDGSIVIFDDWYCFRNRDELGEQKALREWLGRNSHLKATPYKEFGPDGKAFIVNRSSKQSTGVSSAGERPRIEHPELIENLKTENHKVDGLRDADRLPESPTVPLQECEYVFELVNDGVMTRTIEGRISFWNRRAEELYGWRKEEAIGRVSHDLLQTLFPQPLEEIDSELVRNGQWEGKLVHTTRDGGRVTVESRWTLAFREQAKAVVEINRPAADAELIF